MIKFIASIKLCTVYLQRRWVISLEKFENKVLFIFHIADLNKGVAMIFFEKGFTMFFFFIFIFTNIANSQNDLSEKEYLTLQKKWISKNYKDLSLTNTEKSNWIKAYWRIRENYPDTPEADQATLKAYNLAKKYHDFVAKDSLFQQISIHEDAMAEILNSKPFGPPPTLALKKLTSIRNSTNNPRVEISALIEIAEIRSNLFEYDQVSKILDTLKTHFDISNIDSEYGEQVRDLEKKNWNFTIGRKLKNFHTITVNDQIVTSNKLQGRVVLLYFYGSGCGSCIKMYPVLNRLYKQYHGKDFYLLGIAYDRPFFTEVEFLNRINKYEIEWPQTLQEELFKQYQVQQLSTIFLLNKNQELVLTSISDHISQVDKDLKDLTLEDAVVKLINQ